MRRADFIQLHQPNNDVLVVNLNHVITVRRNGNQRSSLISFSDGQTDAIVVETVGEILGMLPL